MGEGEVVEIDQAVVLDVLFFFFFFLKSILAYGLDHGESPWLRKAT